MEIRTAFLRLSKQVAWTVHVLCTVGAAKQLISLNVSHKTNDQSNVFIIVQNFVQFAKICEKYDRKTFSNVIQNIKNCIHISQ